MNKLSILFLFFFTNIVVGQNKDDVIRKVVETCNGFKNYEIAFESVFKSSMAKDTLQENCHSEVSRKNKSSYIGWHNITRRSGQNKNRLITCSENEMVTLNYSDSTYYITGSDFNDPAHLGEEKRKYMYLPALREKSDYKNFEIIESDSEHLLLKQMLEKLDAGSGVTIYSTALLTINARTFFPEMEELWVHAGSHVQYSRFKLLNVHLFPDEYSKVIKKKTDSLSDYSKKFKLGEVFSNSKKAGSGLVKTGDHAADFSALINGSNDSFHLVDYRESIVVLDFFFTSCGPCVKAIPDLKSICIKYSKMGVKMVGFDPFQADWTNLTKYADYFNINYDLLKGGKETALAYGVDGYPTLFIIKNGIIVKIMDGYEKGLAKSLDKELTKLIQQ